MNRRKPPPSPERRVMIKFAIMLVILWGLFFVAMRFWLPAHSEPFDWDRYHERQDACLERDRIVAACVQGYCDELALRQAARACSPFSGARARNGGRL
jgi:hypothetical protein